MKIKKILSIILISVLLSSNMVFAVNENDKNIELPNEKPATNFEENNKIDEIEQKIKIEDLEKSKKSNQYAQKKSASSKSKKFLKSATKSTDKYEGHLVENKNDIPSTFVVRDGKHYSYLIDETVLPVASIYRYCFETQEDIEIYHDEELMINDYSYYIHNNIFLKDEMIYFAAFSKNDDNHLHLVGYNTQTEKISYSNIFDISKDSYAESFCIDDNENAYIVIKGQTEGTYRINSYNKKAKLISKLNNDVFDSFYSIKITNANNNMIWIEAYVENGNYISPRAVAMRVNNGKFITEKYAILRKMRMEIKFLNEEKNIAYDEYGEILQFNYTDTSVSFTVLNYITIDKQKTLTVPFENTIEGSYLYAGGEKGTILKYNWDTFKIERLMSIGENKDVIGTFKDGDKLYIEYMDPNTYAVYALILDYEDFMTPQQTIELTNNTTLNRTKDDIKSKYKELKIVNEKNYNNAYAEAPSVTAPYKAGSLNEQTKNDTLNQINYFRWLAGVNEVTINEKYMEHAQSGAVLLTTSSQLMHNPPQPSDMDDDFYKKAVGATNADLGVNMSANISQYSPLAESIKGYVDDIYNLEPNVGHRLSLLDYRATTTSFGYAEKYGTVDMFITTNQTRTEDFYAWPPAGDVPVEAVAPKAMWSLEYDTTKYFEGENFNFKLKANNKEYSSQNGDIELYFDNYYNTYYYKLPNELITYLSDGKSNIQENKTVEVEVTGLIDYTGNEYIIKYPVRFFSVNSTEPTYKRGDVNMDGKVNAGDYVAILNYVRKKIVFTDEQLQRADANGDGKVNAGDYVTILNIVRGKI